MTKERPACIVWPMVPLAFRAHLAQREDKVSLDLAAAKESRVYLGLLVVRVTQAALVPQG